MDEMGPRLEGLVTVVLWMTLAAAVLLALVGLWLGWRRVRRGQLRRALAWQSALAAGVLWTGGLGLWNGDPFQDNPWLWLCTMIAAPALGGHLLGVAAGLLARRS
ncbi:MAG: hypothetical protein H6898_08955 [Rhodobacter sp.]|nr:hypothetical protein [Rhodobacter sp.]